MHTTNLLNQIVSDLSFRIPREILAETFLNKDARRARSSISLDEAILQDVIRPRVMVDMNLVGGSIANVDLSNIAPQMLDYTNLLFVIPPERTGGRGIVSVLSAGFVPYTIGAHAYDAVVVNGTCGTAGTAMNALGSVYASHADMRPVAQTDVELVGPFSVVVRHTAGFSGYYVLRAILAYDEALNQINPRSYPAVTKLCEYAVKAYIYNVLRIRIDRAQVVYGQELGVFREYVDSYSDAEENYQTYLKEVLQNVLFMNDRESHRRFMRLQIQPTL